MKAQDRTRRRVKLAVGVSAAIALYGCSSSDPGPLDRRPNVILISIDSLRADHLGAYGYERETSPALDEFAKEGVLFEDVSSSTSWTLPSHATLFTGLPGAAHGANRSRSTLAPSYVTLAESLAELNYRTAGFWSGPFLHPRFGLAQGFDEYVSCASYQVFSNDDMRATAKERSDSQKRANQKSHVDITNPTLFGAADDWLRSNSDEPFFLFLHVWDVHYDFIPPAPYDTKFDPDYEGTVDGRNFGGTVARRQEPLAPRDEEHLIALYDGEIAWTDEHLGRLFSLLKELDLEENTIVVVTADHGEEFFEHGKYGHRKGLYEEVLHVPLIMRWPGQLDGGKRLSAPAGLADIAPTILDLVAARPLDDVMGVSLAPRIAGDRFESDAPSSTVVAELYRGNSLGELVAIRSEPLKLILKDRQQAVGLFDLDADPREQRDLGLADPKAVGRAREKMEPVLRMLDQMAVRYRTSDGKETPLHPDLERELKGLGYLGDEGR